MSELMLQGELKLKGKLFPALFFFCIDSKPSHFLFCGSMLPPSVQTRKHIDFKEEELFSCKSLTEQDPVLSTIQLHLQTWTPLKTNGMKRTDVHKPPNTADGILTPGMIWNILKPVLSTCLKMLFTSFFYAVQQNAQNENVLF